MYALNVIFNSNTTLSSKDILVKLKFTFGDFFAVIVHENKL